MFSLGSEGGRVVLHSKSVCYPVRRGGQMLHPVLELATTGTLVHLFAASLWLTQIASVPMTALFRI